MCPGENKGGHQNTPREAWTEKGQRPGHPRCHPPTDHVTPTANSCHPLMKAERFCRKFGNFFHRKLTLCAEGFIRKHIANTCVFERIFELYHPLPVIVSRIYLNCILGADVQIHVPEK